MPDIKVTELTELTTLSANDLLYVVDDPLGTPTGTKLVASNIPTFVPDLANNASPASSGLLMVFGGGGGSTTPQKTTVNDFGLAGQANVGARVYSASAQTVPNATTVAMTMELTSYDTHGFHDPTAGSNARLEIPAGLDGTYAIGGQIQYEANATGERFILIRKNTTDNLAIIRVNANTAGGGETAMVAVTTTSLVENDFVDVAARQGAGANVDIEAVVFYTPVLWIQKVG